MNTILQRLNFALSLVPQLVGLIQLAESFGLPGGDRLNLVLGLVAAGAQGAGILEKDLAPVLTPVINKMVDQMTTVGMLPAHTEHKAA